MTAIRRVDPRTDPLWAELASGEGGSLFTSPPWIDAVCGTYGFVPDACVEWALGRPLGGVAWVDVHDDVLGHRRQALPFCDRGDPVAADADTWALLGTELLDVDLPVTMRCLADSPAVADPRFAVVNEAAWHATALDRPLEHLRAALRPQTRRNIATAERAGVEIVLSADADAVAEYHRLHVGLRKRKYRLLAQPLEFFVDPQGLHPGRQHPHGARAGRGPARGRRVYLVWSDTLYYKFGASTAESLPLRPNDALHWRLIGWAHDRGLRRLDWGLSDLDQPGLCAYKRNWASPGGAGFAPRWRPSGGPAGKRPRSAGCCGRSRIC